MQQSDLDNLTVGERIAAPTPKFFKKLGGILLTVSAVCTAIISLPVALPAIVVTVAGYVLAGTTVAAAVTGLPVDKDKLQQQQSEQQP